MNKFKVGVRVIVIGDNQEVRKGVIQSLFEEMRLSIVKFDNGDVEKVRFDNMCIDPETKAQDEKAPEPVKNESREGVKVITKTQFTDILMSITTPEGMLGDKVNEVDPMSLMLKSMAVIVVGRNISNELFQDKEEIEITRDQLREVIKENCKPSALVKSVDGKMSLIDVMPIALLSGAVLSEIIFILFDDFEK